VLLNLQIHRAASHSREGPATWGSKRIWQAGCTHFSSFSLVLAVQRPNRSTASKCDQSAEYVELLGTTALNEGQSCTRRRHAELSIQQLRNVATGKCSS